MNRILAALFNQILVCAGWCRWLRVPPLLIIFAAVAWCDCSGSVQYTIGSGQTPVLACQITPTGGAFAYTSSVVYTNPAAPAHQWLTVTPASGSIAAGVSGVINYNIDPTSLSAGEYFATVTLHAAGFADSTDQIHLTVVGGSSTSSVSINLPAVPGLTIVIDGSSYSSSQTFLWVVGSVHTISVPAITNSSGVEITFVISLSNSSAAGNPLQVTVPANPLAITISQVGSTGPPSPGNPYSISTFAGGALPVNAAGLQASLYGPTSVAIDKGGNVYFIDQFDVLYLDRKTGLISLAAGNGTLGNSGDNGAATAAQLNPAAIAVDTLGNLFIADAYNNRIRRVSAGVITTIAGQGGLGFGGDGGPATGAQINSPLGIAVDAAGNVFFADSSNNRIRKIAGGTITTVAGNGMPGFGGDGGAATSAMLFRPFGISIDSAGSLYIADTSNNRIRKVSSGTITTIAGNGVQGFSGDGGPATAAMLNSPTAIAVDGTGAVYFSASRDYRVRKVQGGVITTIAGNGMPGSSGDGGPAINAQLNSPTGLAVDAIGDLYIADGSDDGNNSNRVREISAGLITTIAGNGTFGSSGDNGSATSAELNFPYLYSGFIAVDNAGNLYLDDTANNRIRKISTNGIITTFAGNGNRGFGGDGGPAAAAQLNYPSGIAVDGAGNVYFAEESNYRVRKISGGVISTVAGTGSSGFSGDGGPATLAQLSFPTGVAVDQSGNVYVVDDSRVRKISSGVITTVAGNGTAGTAGDGGPALNAQLNRPVGIAVDSSGNLFIGEYSSSRVRKVSNGTITTVAGNGTQGFSGDGGPAVNASLSAVTGVAVDTAGNLFISDAGNGRIREISNGVITTVAGEFGCCFSGDGGAATAAQLYAPQGLAVASDGRIYVADVGNERIRLLTPGTSPSINSNGIAPVFSTISVVQSGSWLSIFGANLASGTFVWKGDFPTSLGGTSVTVDNRPAYLWYVSPTQINLQVPDDSVTGSVNVVVTTPTGTATSTVTLASQGPSFSLLADGKHVAAEIPTPNGTGAYGGGSYDLVGPSNVFSYSTRPVKQGEILTLYGVGFGPTSPQVLAGHAFSGAAPTNNPVTVSIGGVNANVAFAGIVAAGLYQINVTVPAGVGTGDVAIHATINGVQTPSGPVVTVQ